MDITVYDKIYEAFELALKDFNTESGFNVAIAHYAPSKPTYPLIVLSEIRNQPHGKFYAYNEGISSMGYKVDIFAKTKAPYSKQDIARKIMRFAVDFMQRRIKLLHIGTGFFENVGTNGELYEIALTFQQNFNEKQEYFY